MKIGDTVKYYDIKGNDACWIVGDIVEIDEDGAYFKCKTSVIIDQMVIKLPLKEFAEYFYVPVTGNYSIYEG